MLSVSTSIPCFLVGTSSQLIMEAVTLDPPTRSSSFRVILTKPLTVPISLHLQSRSNISSLLVICPSWDSPYLVLPFTFRYSSMNEINKITHESNGSRVFVYFITRLPRMEGGTSYIGFHGGKVNKSCDFFILYRMV